MLSGSSYIAGGGFISVSVCRVILSGLLHLFTASTLRTPMDTPTTRVNTNVRTNVTATAGPVDNGVPETASQYKEQEFEFH